MIEYLKTDDNSGEENGMRPSTEEYLSGALDLATMVGGMAFHIATIMVTGKNTSHTATSVSALQKWRNAQDHFESARNYKKDGN